MRLAAFGAFLEMGGFGQFAAGLASSYDAIPVFTSASRGMNMRAMAAAATVASAKLFAVGLALCTPVLTILLLADLVFALVDRVMPLKHDDPSQPVKMLLGMGALLLGLGGLETAMQATLAQFLSLVRFASRW
jgi:flagellar biosynthesis protein FliR